MAYDLSYILCSSPDCSFSAKGNEDTHRCCPYCGNDLIYRCPHCGNYFEHKGQLFCVQCREKIKSDPPSSQPRTSDNNE